MNAKHIFIVAFLLFFFSTKINAQERYDLAMVRYEERTTTIFVSYNNAEYQQIPTEAKMDKGNVYNFNPLLKFASSLTDKGWEVINICETGSFVTYYFKKKK